MLKSQAKTILRKHRAVQLLEAIPLLLFVLTLLINRFLLRSDISVFKILIGFALFELAWLFVMRFLRARATQRYLYSPWWNELNVPLFAEITRQIGRKNDPYALWRITAAYAEGRYAEVVSLCSALLNYPRAAKKMRFSYLMYLEMAYFELGDDHKLGQVYTVMERYLKGHPREAKLRAGMPLHSFFTAYLKRDIPACEAYFSSPSLNRMTSVRRLLLMARVALVKGETDTARGLLEQVLDQAPDTGFHLCARATLDTLDRGEGFESAFSEVLPNSSTPSIGDRTVLRKHQTRTKAWNIVTGLLLAVLLVHCVFSLHLEREEQQYWDSLEAAVQEYFRDAELLGLHEITENGRAVDVIAVCQCQNRVVLGGIYIQNDSEDEELMFRFGTSFSDKDMQDSPLPTKAYFTYLSEQIVICKLFSTEEEVPENACFSYSVTLNQRTYWLAVTYAEDDAP